MAISKPFLQDLLQLKPPLDVAMPGPAIPGNPSSLTSLWFPLLISSFPWFSGIGLFGIELRSQTNKWETSTYNIKCTLIWYNDMQSAKLIPETLHWSIPPLEIWHDLAKSICQHYSRCRQTQTSRSGRVWPSNINTTMTPPSIFKVGSKRPPLRLWPRKNVEGFSRLQWVRKFYFLTVTIWWMGSHPGILTPK